MQTGAITMEQLRVLDAVVTTGTFRAAADALHKTQPAVSHAIKSLETAVGFTLLSRDGYRPELTAAGRRFHRQAGMVLSQMRDLGTLADRLADRHEPEVSLAVSATLPMQPLLGIVGTVGRNHPETHIRLVTDMMGGAAERLMSGDADIIIAPEDSAPGAEVDRVLFQEFDILPVARPDYGPQRGTGPFSDAAMRNFVQVVVAGTGTGAFRQSRDVLPGGRNWTVSDLTAKKEIILAGQGWGGLPGHLVQDELNSGALVQLDLPCFPPRRSRQFVMRRRDRPVGLVGDALWRALSEGGAEFRRKD